MTRYHIAVGAFLSVAGLCAAPCTAAAKKIARYIVNVDDRDYRVTRFNDGSVRVSVLAAFSIVGPNTIRLRDRERLAARKATGCEVVDDFMQGPQLFGRLQCDATHEQ